MQVWEEAPQARRLQVNTRQEGKTLRLPLVQLTRARSSSEGPLFSVPEFDVDDCDMAACAS